MLTSLAFGLLFQASPAEAASCDSLLKKVDSAQGEAIATAFSALAKCDKTVAEDNYGKFMAKATDADSLVALSSASIEADVWNPVWQQLSKIKDYDARDEVAQRVGESCGGSEKVVSFLQGAYFGLRDIDFQQWDDAYVACDAPAMLEWMEKQVATPPNRVFDDKFNALLAVYVQKKRSAALPTLAKAAALAAENGPYDAILIKMDEAVAPSLGEALSTEDQAALESALIEVARAVAPDKARAVADRLANSGSQAAAAKLLPAIYPDRVQSGGGFLYGGAAMEMADCKGTKTAIIHVAEVIEPGRRWLIFQDASGPMRTFKPKLGKCTAEGGEWAVSFTSEPVKSSKEIDPWVESISQGLVEKGYEVKTQSEKGLRLP